MKIFNRTGKGRFSSFRSFVRRAWFWTKVSFYAALFGGVFMGIGAVWFSSHTIEAQTVTQAAPDAPILERIADCESGTGKPGTGTQFRKDGSVVTNANTNGTVDVGKYQINLNPAHIREMATLGLNPLTEEGNTAYAKFLYENHGTGDWDSSAHCWRK
jgi:hypothetical protein